MTEFTCPCCGQPIVAPPQVQNLSRIPLVGTQKVILESLIKAHPYGIQSDRMIQILWPNADNEPDHARTGISVVMGRLREKLKAHGWTIPLGHVGRGNKATYKLESMIL